MRLAAAPASVAPPAALRTAATCRYVGLSRATIHRLRSAGDFPPPLRLTTTSVAWLVSDLDAWLASRRVVAPTAAA